MERRSDINIPDYFPDDLPKFLIGEVVKHKRYGYRGVIVDFDMRCLAEDSWYVSNQERPDKDQPWYHILVHGSSVNTYAAEESLMIIPNHGGTIEHPLIDVFFEPFEGDCYDEYIRNDEHWQGWQG